MIELTELDMILMDEILKHTDEFEEMKSVVNGLTQEQEKILLRWLKKTPNATRHQIVLKAYHISELGETD